ncbi:MAG: permease prefix domain 1-containing protein [Candidatus Promineifilaceae bacterium]
MNLIDRYMNEVGRRLPRKQRSDVKNELRSLLEDTLDDRVEGLPTEADMVALLEEFGSPEKVAASYRPSGQYLVGPELFPLFKIVFGAVILAVTIGLTVAFFMGAVFTTPENTDLGQRLLNYVGGYFQALLAATGSIVILFAILQRLGVKPDIEGEGDWDPRDLPDVKNMDVVGRGESIVGITFSAVFLVLLNVFSDRIGVVVSWGDEPMLTDIVQQNLVWLNLAIFIGLLLQIVLLWQGRWHIYTRVARLAIDLLWLYIINQVVTALDAGKQTLIDAGLTEPLPTMLVVFGYLILAAVAIGIVVNFVKVIVNMVRKPIEGLQIELG